MNLYYVIYNLYLFIIKGIYIAPYFNGFQGDYNTFSMRL